MRKWIASQSKKLWVALIGAVILTLSDAFGLSTDQVMALTALASSYLLGQGVADLGKGKVQAEKIK